MKKAIIMSKIDLVPKATIFKLNGSNELFSNYYRKNDTCFPDMSTYSSHLGTIRPYYYEDLVKISVLSTFRFDAQPVPN